MARAIGWVGPSPSTSGEGQVETMASRSGAVMPDWPGRRIAHQ